MYKYANRIDDWIEFAVDAPEKNNALGVHEQEVVADIDRTVDRPAETSLYWPIGPYTRKCGWRNYGSEHFAAVGLIILQYSIGI